MTVILFLVGVVFGAVGVIGKDGVAVFNYVFSADNLKSANPVIIGTDNKLYDMLDKENLQKHIPAI